MGVPKIKLTYYNNTGRAEAIRITLFVGELPFDDVRIQYTDWAEVKNTLPNIKHLPFMEVDRKVLHA